MLKFQIRNYDEFREIFGTRCSSRGCIVNKVLLSFWKHRFKIDGDGRASQIKNMQDLFNLVKSSLEDHNPIGGFHTNYIGMGGFNFRFRSTTIEQPLDSSRWIDLKNPKNIRFVDRSHQSKICSMGAGKFFRRILKENQVRLDESTITYCSEEFQRLWEAEVRKLTSGYVLHVDQHFDRIYNQNYLQGCFSSCMVGRNQHSFYKNSVKASAAYLTKEGDPHNMIYARCIIYHDVFDSQGNKHNYAERQYSSDGQEVLKTILISKLIEAEIIDIYKAIGAGCREVTNIVNIDGTRFDHPFIRTKCNIRPGATKSFLDTFKYLCQDGWLYNYLPANSGNHVEMDHTTSVYSGFKVPITEFDRSDVPII